MLIDYTLSFKIIEKNENAKIQLIEGATMQNSPDRSGMASSFCGFCSLSSFFVVLAFYQAYLP